MINNTIEIKSVLKNGTYTEGKEIGSGSSGTITEIFSDSDTTESPCHIVVKHFDSADDNTFRDDCFKEVSNLLLIKDRALPGILKLLDVVVYEATDHVDQITGSELEKINPDEDSDIILPGVGIILPRMDCDLMTALESGNLKAAHKAKIFTDILVGTAALHKAGIIHHDLKTENVLLSYGGSCTTKTDIRAVICDLSFAEVATEPRKISTSGTRGYMAPECVYAEGPAWFAKDIWSVGCIALELFGKIIPEELDDEPSLKYVIEERDKLGRGVFPEMIKRILCEDQTKRPTAMDLVMGGPSNVTALIDPCDIEALHAITPISLPDIRITLPKKFPKSEKAGFLDDKALRNNVLYFYELFEAVNPSCVRAAECYYKAARGRVPVLYCVVAAMKVYDGSEVPDVEFIREEAIEDYNEYVAYMYEYEIMRAMNFQMWII